MFENKITAYYGAPTVRQQQIQMAFDIAHFLQEGNKRILLVEAPVGTGKSLGILVPALVDIHQDIFNTNKRILYATSTISLQGQLMSSEVPLLKSTKLVKNPLLAIGKTHYYCHHRLSKLNASNKFSPLISDKLEEFFNFSKTGQRSELEEAYDLDLEDKDWSKIELLATPYECDNCPFSLSCPTRLHRKQFRSSKNDLTITNHDQLIVSLLGAMEEGRSQVLNIDPGIIVIDEAHHFLENFLGRIEENKRLRNIKVMSKFIRNTDKKTLDNNVRALENWIETIKQDKKESDKGRSSIPSHIKDKLRQIKKIIDDNLISADYAAEDALDDISLFLDKINREEYVGWFDFEDDKFCLIPRNFKEKFTRLIDTMKRYNRVIFTSGTITVNGDFTSILKQWGLERSDVLTLAFGTPFDYKNQSLIYIPDTLVKPDHVQFITTANNEIHRLLKLTDGRTLILNTSKVHMLAFYQGIESYLNESNIPLYLQGKMGVDRLTKKFKENENSVLIGSGSFFSGFSVTGMALTSVILNRLPFPVKDDPIYELLSQGLTEQETFSYVTFPTMINKLDQAVGRLIRSIEDFGIFTLLDTRVFEFDYGKSVRVLLEEQGYTITRTWEDVEKFYQRKVKLGAEATYEQYKREKINVHPSLIKELKEKRTAPIVKAAKAVNQPKKNGLTRKQREFLKEISEKEGIKLKFKKSTSDSYNDMFQELYYSWKDTQHLIDHFPYRDEEERNALSEITGVKRRTFFPKCTRFGCSGNCKEEEHDKIVDHLYKEYGATVINFIKNRGFSLIEINPVSLLETYPFKPEESQLVLTSR
ncbi:ATP-dependent DNA helicase [Metabacillus schmidteae]|uniref:ATP-dependent DNA helicase n=1 Tax=Metabacillus schmidteae TaxID=2730405 RepID=UPI0015898C11|nr:ATP-dependent DNA helicase [Metabacillus schmidteae]